MVDSYDPTVWANDSLPAIDAAALLNIEAGIEATHGIGGGVDRIIIHDGPNHYIRIPALTTALRDDLTSAPGTLIYNSSIGSLQVECSDGWQDVIAGPVGSHLNANGFIINGIPTQTTSPQHAVTRNEVERINVSSRKLSNVVIDTSKNFGGYNFTGIHRCRSNAFTWKDSTHIGLQSGPWQAANAAGSFENTKINLLQFSIPEHSACGESNQFHIVLNDVVWTSGTYQTYYNGYIRVLLNNLDIWRTPFLRAPEILTPLTFTSEVITVSPGSDIKIQLDWYGFLSMSGGPVEVYTDVPFTRPKMLAMAGTYFEGPESGRKE